MTHPFLAHRQIGDFRVTALSDGNMAANLDFLSGIATSEAVEIQNDAGIADPANIHINSYLVHGRGRRILIDAGRGELNNAGGQLSASLSAVGLSPNDIDTLLLTHCHPDHIGGLLDAEGRPLYQHADVYLHPLEAAYWLSDERQKEASERAQRNFSLARRTLDAYAKKLHFLDENSKIAEQILPVWLPGHTPGHTGFHIISEGKSLLIWGDVVHFPHIQSAHPDVSIAFDYDPAQAKATRMSILERAAKENLLIAGMHLGKEGFARVQKAKDGYRIQYAEA